ncbi:MAG TPA: hypothetical protein ENJ18_09865 [Nannocystis exedens]|nr:hypothetical protein [Nannocystis exedens]
MPRKLYFGPLGPLCLRITAAYVFAVGLACTHATAPAIEAQPPATPVTPPKKPAVRPDTPSLRYTLSPDEDADLQAWIVTIEARGPGKMLREWSIRRGTKVEFLEIVDSAGKLSLGTGMSSTDGGRMRVQFARTPSSPLRLRYRIRDDSRPADRRRRPAIHLDREHLAADADALLLRPDLLAETLLPIQLDVEMASPPVDEFNVDAPPLLLLATTFGLGAISDERPLRPADLGRAAIIAGPLEWARFDGFGGNDRFAFIGPAVFDVRWAAAEMAGLRSAIDLYFAYTSDTPYTTLVSLTPQATWEPPFTARLRARGLFLRGDSRMSWGASARMSVAMPLVGRWLGGRVRLFDDTSNENERKNERKNERAMPGAEMLWFSGGVSRFIAWQLLYGLGALTDDEFVAEINAWEAALSTSRFRQHTRLELAAIAEGQGSEAEAARALLVARGALYATSLDARIRKNSRGWASLKSVVTTIVSIAIVDEVRDLPLSLWLKIVGGETERPADADFKATIDRGERPALAPDALGPCFRPRPTSYRRFDLGFVDQSSSAGELVIGELDPKGPASRAGLRTSDVIKNLSYAPGSPESKVHLEIERDNKTLTIEYLPAGPKRRGIAWRRKPGIADELCIR